MSLSLLRLVVMLNAASLLFLCLHGRAEEPASSQPKVIPLTRPEMKGALEALKSREPRLPLPPLSPEEIAAGRFSVNNGRMRSLYLPAEWSSSRSRSPASDRPVGERRGFDQSGTVDGTFKVWLFWIVSRANNCHYCMGHQELKLRGAGMADDEIASLDCDWSKYPANQRVAMELARKMTNAPHLISDADINALRPYYSAEQISEIVFTVARYNSTNRWTDSLGIPQDQRFSDRDATIDTPTSERFANVVSEVAPLKLSDRPTLESRSEVESIWQKLRTRKPRLPVADDASIAKAFPEESGPPHPQWVRAFAPVDGRNVSSLRAMATTGRIPAKLKAMIAWSAARENRAWYSAHHAKQSLNDIGLDDTAVFSLDSAGKGLSKSEREALTFARKLTSTPHGMADADIARLREHYEDGEVAEIVYVVCQANMFDRFTEAVGLPLDQ
ncbi:MAG: carboxymuconolactone decarboxylase family protein [Planctomycetales bacterium]|nr:carboxymuconolactone decarboxylase family protein [Planctomycetales bacterium]